MFISQTIQEYLDNPMGKGSTAIANRNLIRSDLDRRYDELLKKHKTFEHKVYLINGSYVFHFKIPSETKRENTYDVVLQLYAPEEEIKKDLNIKRYVMKVFSNSPAFNYTYAYVYNDYDLLIPELKNKYDKIVLTDNPITKNPGEIINFEKSIYFSCKFIMTHSTLYNKLSLESFGTKTNMTKVVDSIRSYETIEYEINKELIRQRAIKLKEKDDKVNLRKKKDYSKVKNIKKLKTPKTQKIAKIKKITPKKKFRVTK